MLSSYFLLRSAAEPDDGAPFFFFIRSFFVYFSLTSGSSPTVVLSSTALGEGGSSFSMLLPDPIEPFSFRRPDFFPEGSCMPCEKELKSAAASKIPIPPGATYCACCNFCNSLSFSVYETLAAATGCFGFCLATGSGTVATP